MSTVEVLRKAKAELERRGWYQGAFGPFGALAVDKDDCPVCAWGALNAARTGDPFHCGTLGEGHSLTLLQTAISDGAGPTGVANWNDTPGRTVEEVLNAFDRAIALAEASEPPKGGTP